MIVQQGGLECLPEIIRRILEVAAPDKIILFGSGAGGTMGPHSDLDLLVIKEGSYQSRKIAGEIYMKLRGIPSGCRCDSRYPPTGRAVRQVAI